jgi:hypothetical protein
LWGLVDALERPELLAAIHRLIQHQLSEQTVAQEDLRQLLPAALVEQLVLALVVQAVRGQPHPLMTNLAVVVVQVVIQAQAVLVLSALPEVTVLAAVVGVAQVATKPLAAEVLGCWVPGQAVRALQVVPQAVVGALAVKQALRYSAHVQALAVCLVAAGPVVKATQELLVRATAATARFASSGPVQPAHSHQLTLAHHKEKSCLQKLKTVW